MPPPPPPQIHVNLVQKPTRKQTKKIEATLRDLKHRGFNLYYECKTTTSALCSELRDIVEAMRQKQIEIEQNQYRILNERVEKRLTETQEDFLIKCEISAQKIFDLNHIVVN